MHQETSQNHSACPSPEISAYLDGELRPSDEMRLDMHFAGCSICREELNSQKNLLQALSVSLESEKDFELPKNFTKTIVANAESRVNGLRQPRERYTAVFICSALFVFLAALLGSELAGIFGSAGEVADRTSAVVGFGASLTYSLAFGITVIVRSLVSQLATNTTFSLAVLAFVALAGVFFTRLLIFQKRT